jgi:hypothetical protein
MVGVSRRIAVVVAMLVGGLFRPGQAQDMGGRTVTGTVVDSSNNKALSGAMVYANRQLAENRTARDGSFKITADALEPFFVVRAPGYVPARVSWSAADSAGSVGTVRLRKVKSDQDRFALQTEDIRVYPQLAQFYDRRINRGQGAFLTPDEVMQRGTAALSMVIRQMAGMSRMCLVNRERQLDCGRSLNRGPTTIMNQEAQPNVCVASIWYYGYTGPSHYSLDEVRMDEVIAIEGYERPGAAPAEFNSRDCGSIVLWMKPD